MKISSIILLMFIYLFTSCEGKQTTTARIFERREVAQNKLMIKYSFLVKGKAIVDSTIIENKVLNSDFLTVMFNTANPSENSVQLPR